MNAPAVVTQRAIDRAAPPQLVSSHMVRIHDVRAAFPNLKVSGIARYAERALLLPGTVVVPTGVDRSYLAYLRDVGIGAPAHGGVIEVALSDPNDTLISRLTPGQLDQIRQLVDAGSKLEFFMPTHADQTFVRNVLGRNYSDTSDQPGCVWGPNPDLAQRANNKIWLRRAAEAHGLDVNFPEYRIFDVILEEAAVRRQIDTFVTSQKFRGAVPKHPSLASGKGVFVIRNTGDLSWQAKADEAVKLLQAYRQPGQVLEILVEAFYNHISLSIQYEYNLAGARVLALTRQEMTGDTTPVGNLISSSGLLIPDSNLTPEQIRAIEAEVIAQTMPLAQLAWNKGFRGNGSYDLMYVPETGETLPSEKNGRNTAPTGPTAVGLQLEDDDWVIDAKVWDEVVPTTWRELAARLAYHNALFDGHLGILPMVPSLLPQGKAMFLAVGPDLATTTHLVEQARELLPRAA
jgi:hypothetical protein